jgi:hypothetical protein
MWLLLGEIETEFLDIKKPSGKQMWPSLDPHNHFSPAAIAENRFQKNPLLQDTELTDRDTFSSKNFHKNFTYEPSIRIDCLLEAVLRFIDPIGKLQTTVPLRTDANFGNV